MNRRTILTTLIAASIALLAALHHRRRPRVWIGLHLEDGMLIALGPDEPDAPALRACAGDVIRALGPPVAPPGERLPAPPDDRPPTAVGPAAAATP